MIARDPSDPGRDRIKRGVGLHPLADWNHPGCLLADGRLIGAWGRRGGRVEVRVAAGLPAAARAAIEAEALALPIPGATTRVHITEVPDTA